MNNNDLPELKIAGKSKGRQNDKKGLMFLLHAIFTGKYAAIAITVTTLGVGGTTYVASNYFENSATATKTQASATEEAASTGEEYIPAIQRVKNDKFSLDVLAQANKGQISDGEKPSASAQNGAEAGEGADAANASGAGGAEAYENEAVASAKVDGSDGEGGGEASAGQEGSSEETERPKLNAGTGGSMFGSSGGTSTNMMAAASGLLGGGGKSAGRPAGVMGTVQRPDFGSRGSIESMSAMGRSFKGAGSAPKINSSGAVRGQLKAMQSMMIDARNSGTIEGMAGTANAAWEGQTNSKNAGSFDANSGSFATPSSLSSPAPSVTDDAKYESKDFSKTYSGKKEDSSSWSGLATAATLCLSAASILILAASKTTSNSARMALAISAMACAAAAIVLGLVIAIGHGQVAQGLIFALAGAAAVVLAALAIAGVSLGKVLDTIVNGASGLIGDLGGLFSGGKK